MRRKPVDRLVFNAGPINQIPGAQPMIPRDTHDGIIGHAEFIADFGNLLIGRGWRTILAADHDKSSRPNVEAVAVQAGVAVDNPTEPIGRIVLPL